MPSISRRFFLSAAAAASAAAGSVNAFYEPHVDNGFGLNVRPHHRKFYGPGKDISYGSL
jgi:hypothetical protein